MYYYWGMNETKKSRNPLKSGQCFLQERELSKNGKKKLRSQSPQIGSMFLTGVNILLLNIAKTTESQSPQIGSMFLTRMVATKTSYEEALVAIPSNRVNVSYSTYLEKEKEEENPNVAIPSNRVNVSYLVISR